MITDFSGVSKMNTDIVTENEIGSNDITHWIHECNRYLFLAKVHLKEPTVHPQIAGDPVHYIETIFNLGKVSPEEEMTSHKLLLQEPGEESTIVSVKDTTEFKFDLSRDEISQLKQMFEKISSKNWEEIELKDIERSQKILCDLLMSTKKRLHELRCSYNS